MPVDRSKRVKNMFAAPKTANLPTEGQAVAPPEVPPKKDVIEVPATSIDLIEEKTDKPLSAEKQTIIQIMPDSDNPPATEKVSKPQDKGKEKAKQPKVDVINKVKDTEATKFKGPTVHLGCRVSNEMKNALDDMAKDFAYLARKEYGIKIKDDASSIQRAFLILGMSCFTEKVRHKILQEYDHESLMQDEVAQKLLELMRIHNVEIDDMDF